MRPPGGKPFSEGCAGGAELRIERMVERAVPHHAVRTHQVELESASGELQHAEPGDLLPDAILDLVRQVEQTCL